MKRRGFWIMTYVGETDFRSMEAPKWRVLSRDRACESVHRNCGKPCGNFARCRRKSNIPLALERFALCDSSKAEACDLRDGFFAHRGAAEARLRAASTAAESVSTATSIAAASLKRPIPNRSAV